MNISGIRPSIGFYDQNSIRIRPELSSMSVEETVTDIPEESSSASVTEEDIAAARSNQTFGSYDFATQYKPGTVYDMKGSDSDIKSLDVEKAVSDMEKDSAIHRYQYFVANKATSTTETTPVRGTENFSL
ncbi:hypothetical protein SAMN02910377_02284 [Pseudobutyrivibrio ruminis]|uniref:Uncharacterized protein n=1 Tax=Pseudobutyrivibrio ruminis TaxID=46206 RepID=A0A1H7L9H4_9FIRM|nr:MULTISPECIES: hypothetical protein [Pseudobutyrivibrio]SEK95693.1 hypothetical protein SAMN02910377_02284 [Pseudobutyrivibrio ruminis]SET03455.1 hypothetical protein SAMN02910413_1568 [Pseudobutyrivibrio sp. C4]